jgi:hypothetical protein
MKYISLSSACVTFLNFFLVRDNQEKLISIFVTSSTQMYGRYTKDLSEYAKDEARRLKQLERQRKKDDRARNKVDMMIFSYLSSCDILSK